MYHLKSQSYWHYLGLWAEKTSRLTAQKQELSLTLQVSHADDKWNKGVWKDTKDFMCTCLLVFLLRGDEQEEWI